MSTFGHMYPLRLEIIAVSDQESLMILHGSAALSLRQPCAPSRTDERPVAERTRSCSSNRLKARGMRLWDWLTRKSKTASLRSQAPPDFAVTLVRLLPRLDHPAPVLAGVDTEARKRFAAWRSSEKNLRGIADQFEQAGDPQVGQAWLTLAQTVRYQSGRRDDTLDAYIRALYYNRGDARLWQELLDYASFAPHVPTLAEVFSRVPFEVRPKLWGSFEAAFSGYSRARVEDPQKAEELRAVLLRVAEQQGDGVSIAHFNDVQAAEAEKAGDFAAAADAWRRAAATGKAEAPVMDRFTIWLLKQGRYAEAAHALRQVLADPPQGKALRERLEKRLARCEKALAAGQ
ncbi:hypothetical protein ABT340_39740 [Streptosporangium sp. NPDC000239]|uniref:hypothetical protein n=1 Tax=Streptosporangium sp. NPDC000239 TaxID=3154248 RepID=UPI003329C30C